MGHIEGFFSKMARSVQFGPKCHCNAPGYLILNLREAGGTAIEALGPELPVGLSIDQLRVDPNQITSAPQPSIRIISRIPATVRWLNACTSIPRRMRPAAMSGWRSEKMKTRSSFSARILSICRGESAHSRLLAASLRRAHGVAGNPDDAVLLAEQVEGLAGLLGEADNSAGWEYRGPWTWLCYLARSVTLQAMMGRNGMPLLMALIELSAESTKAVVEKPHDRRPEARAALEAAGCTLKDYFLRSDQLMRP
jgi:hypothetical protein